MCDKDDRFVTALCFSLLGRFSFIIQIIKIAYLVVEILGETNWKLQLDNQLPTSINEQIFIERHQWHRVIKGTGTLKLKIHKS